MIIEYNSKYDEVIKNLLIELQEHLIAIDKKGFSKIDVDYKEEYFNKTLTEINIKVKCICIKRMKILLALLLD